MIGGHRRDHIAVELAYGSSGLRVDLPAEGTTVIRPRPRASAADPLAALRTALGDPVAGPPLREIARPGQRVAISVCDITRPQPRPMMLQAIMEALEGIIRPRGRRRPDRHRNPSGVDRSRAARDAR